MKVTEHLHRAALNLPVLERLSGLKLGYLKHLSREKGPPAGPEARAAIAAGFRAHAATLLELASEIEPLPLRDTLPDEP